MRNYDEFASILVRTIRTGYHDLIDQTHREDVDLFLDYRSDSTPDHFLDVMAAEGTGRAI